MVEQYPHQLFIDQASEMALDYDGNWQIAGASYEPVIGDEHYGGIVFYIDSTGKHGLVCATANQSESLQWYNGTYTLTGASGTEVGTGDDNTEKILDAHGIGSYAAAYCRLFNNGAFNDWFLPSIDELRLIKENLFGNGLGGFDIQDMFWSSTEFSYVDAVFMYFYTDREEEGKDGLHKVRAVRKF